MFEEEQQNDTEFSIKEDDVLEEDLEEDKWDSDEIGLDDEGPLVDDEEDF